MIKGIIFDLDGVLVSTDKLHYKAWKRLAEDIGITNYNIKDNQKQCGISRMASLEILLQKSDKLYTLEEKERLADRKNKYYQDLLLEYGNNILLSGAIDTLNLIRDKNLKIAIGSSSKNASQIIKRVGIQSYIDACICGEDIIHSKPNPEIFIKAANAIKIENSLCLVIEDSKAGIEAAKKAGMLTLGVGRYYDSLKADYIAKSLSSVDNWEKILQL